MTLIKICGITNIEDAVESVRLGANLIGFVFAESPRKVDIETVKTLIELLAEMLRLSAYSRKNLKKY